MNRIKKFVGEFRSDGGATSIEYALIATLISILIIAAVTTIGSGLQGGFAYLSDRIAES